MTLESLQTSSNLIARNDARLRHLAETFLAANFHHYSESTTLALMSLIESAEQRTPLTEVYAR